MSALFKGTAGPVVVHNEAQFDAETLTYYKVVVYEGSAAAISGLELSLQADGVSYSVSNNGPVYSLATRIPLMNPDEQSVDRYEISTESTEISIWQNPRILIEAAAYDAARAIGENTYRKNAEDFVQSRTSVVIDPVASPLFETVIAHLRAGIETFPVDYLILRRFRRIPRTYSVGVTGKMNLDSGNLIYTTDELNLPADVAFTIPATPAPGGAFGNILMWGWRKRGQRVEFIDQWVEQTVELIFGQHSTLHNAAAGVDMVW